MDPSRNLALQNAKLQTILLQTAPRRGPSPTASEAGMLPPPAYHTVVDPTDSLPSMHNPYDTEEEGMKHEDLPEINVNATTQIRGHGNIISIAQMDSMRIANLLAILIHGGIPPSAQGQAQGQTQGQQTHAQVSTPGTAERPNQERRELPKINININCGATVIGDRNIVGPGLGDIARHMQIAQQRQQQQQQQQQNQVPLESRTTQPQRPGFGFPVPIQTPLTTPPMSRSSSFGSDGCGGVKRKAEEEQTETPIKRAR